MRNFLRFAAAGAALATVVSFGGVANAATTQSASASVQILSTLNVAKTRDLSFGQVAANGAGALVLAADGTTTCAAALVCTGTRQTAEFTVAGSAGTAVTATLASTSITLSDGASHTMTVDQLGVHFPNGNTLTGGATAFNVGGRLNVGAAQVAGTYTGTFNVSVEYQ